MFKTIPLFFLLSISICSFANSLSCGDAQVTVFNAVTETDPYFKISLNKQLINKTYFFEIQKDNLYVRCEKTSVGKHVVFINHFCGGSGCADIGNWGIIDTDSGVMLLEPNEPFKGNTEKAEEIMGKKVKKFGCTKETDEICIHSAIELG